jgi:hypothetical protein
MTALVLENLAALPAQVQSLRLLLARLAGALDALVLGSPMWAWDANLLALSATTKMACFLA